MRIRGHCIFSHGFESGPDATKVTALALAAERLGWSHERPDYTDLDGMREVSAFGDVPGRLARLQRLANAAVERGPVVLAGSSLGAWISGRVSLRTPVAGLFLMAPPIDMSPAPPLDVAPVPVAIVHGWDDELIPADAVVAWAKVRKAQLSLVDDDHRLAGHVDYCGDVFARFLAAL